MGERDLRNRKEGKGVIVGLMFLIDGRCIVIVVIKLRKSKERESHGEVWRGEVHHVHVLGLLFN